MFCHKNKPFPFCLSKKMQQEQAGAALKKVAPANEKKSAPALQHWTTCILTGSATLGPFQKAATNMWCTIEHKHGQEKTIGSQDPRART